MERSQLLETARDILVNAGFYVSDLCEMRLTGFDLVARRDDMLLIIKVLTNVDSFSERLADELKRLCSLLNAMPLLIGEKNGMGILQDDVVYYRFGIQAITYATFKNHLLEGNPIKVYAAPGGLYVNLDQEKLRKTRLERSVSLGSFARYVRVSRRTVQMYEEGMNARVEIASRIEEFLETPVTIPIHLFNFSLPSHQGLSRKEVPTIHNIRQFQREVFSLLQNIGYKIIPMQRCPFEALSKDREKILLTCIHKDNEKLIKKAHIISSISRITEKHAALFINKNICKKNIEGTPIILKKELKKIRDPEDVFELISERI
jgi:putative transcriptional regulator